MLARHFGLTEEPDLAAVLLALQPNYVVQVGDLWHQHWDLFFIFIKRIFDTSIGIFLSSLLKGSEPPAQPDARECLLLRPRDLPIPGSWTIKMMRQFVLLPRCLQYLVGIVFCELDRSCFCRPAPSPPSTPRAGLSTGLDAFAMTSGLMAWLGTTLPSKGVGNLSHNFKDFVLV